MHGFQIRGERATVGGRVIVGMPEQLLAAAMPDWTVELVPDDTQPCISVDEWMGANGLVWDASSGAWVASELVRYGIEKLVAEHAASTGGL